MFVELVEHRGTNIATGLEIYLGQYRIRVNGRAVGFIKDKPGSNISLVERFSPREVEEIERLVSEQLPGVLGTKMAPDVPAEMMQSDEEYIDDFDA